MTTRPFGRVGWPVAEVGYGMWGLAGWSGSDDEQTRAALRLAVDLGVNFFDTALAYGEGKSERMLGDLVRERRDQRLYVATKVPPRNRRWPSQRGDRLDAVFPPDYVRQSVETSQQNLGVGIDLLQFHVWEDDWAGDDRWQRVVDDLKRQKVIAAAGISINRWQPANALQTLRTGLIDAVQVVYNIFDQAPEDELFPLCRELNVAVIARVPFDEGSLTGTLSKESTWPEGDFRRSYFTPENLAATLERVERLRPLLPPGETLPGLALRFVLSNPDASVVIPGMRQPRNVRSNVGATAALPADLIRELRAHRWDRTTR